jgi:hypothetical protein
VDVFPIALGGLIGVLLFARVLRPISPGVLEITVVAVEALLIVYWGRQLLREVRGKDRYPLVVLFILLGIGTAVGAIAATAL